MAALTLALNDTAKVFAYTPTFKMLTPVELTPPLERSPCNWDIQTIGGGQITARSRQGDQFTGTMDDFNELLRG